MNNANLKEHLTQIYINSADLTEYEQQDGSRSKCLLVKIPYRSITAFHKVSEKVVHHLESKFNWPVIVVATRTIISKRGKYFLTSRFQILHLCDGTVGLNLFMHSKEKQNSKETQKQNSYCSPRSNSRRYCIIYYN
jgi:hypothetical protein